MDLIIALLRFVLRGGSSTQGIVIRLIGIVLMVAILMIWAAFYQPQAPPPPDGVALLPTRGALLEMGTLAFGSTVSGTLGHGERHAWQFAGERGQRVNLRTRGELDSTLELIPPDGTRSIAIDFRSGGGHHAFLCSQRLPANGTYRAVVSGHLALPDRSSGSYELSLTTETYIETRPIAYGETIEGRLTTCDGDHYALAVQPDDQLRVTLIPEAGANLYVKLLEERGASDMLAISRQIVNEDGQAHDVLEAVVEAGAAVVIIQVAAPPNEPAAAYRLSVSRG